MLLELYDHVVEFKIWNKKDMVSRKAFYDRPKAFGVEEAIKSGMLKRGASTSPAAAAG